MVFRNIWLNTKPCVLITVFYIEICLLFLVARICGRNEFPPMWLFASVRLAARLKIDPTPKKGPAETPQKRRRNKTAQSANTRRDSCRIFRRNPRRNPRRNATETPAETPQKQMAETNSEPNFNIIFFFKVVQFVKHFRLESLFQDKHKTSKSPTSGRILDVKKFFDVKKFDVKKFSREKNVCFPMPVRGQLAIFWCLVLYPFVSKKVVVIVTHSLPRTEFVRVRIFYTYEFYVRKAMGSMFERPWAVR